MSEGSRDEWFQGLYRKYYGRIFRFFVRYGRGEADAHDLAQETFARLYTTFDRYRGEAEWGYLETVARRVLLNQIRRSKTQKRAGAVVEIDEPSQLEEQHLHSSWSEHEGSPEKRFLREEMSAALHRAITELSPSQRECLVLRLRDLNYHEISAVLGIPVGAVKSRLHEAREKLREKLGPNVLERE